MDHRCSVRTMIRLPALLRVQAGWIPAVIRNISEEGLFVETTAKLVNHCYVTVRTNLEGHKGRLMHDLPALVVHRNGAGVGLMLAGNEEDAWQRLLARQATHNSVATFGFLQSAMRRFTTPSDIAKY